MIFDQAVQPGKYLKLFGSAAKTSVAFVYNLFALLKLEAVNKLPLHLAQHLVQVRVNMDAYMRAVFLMSLLRFSAKGKWVSLCTVYMIE